MSARAVRGHAGPRQSRGLHHMSDHACRLNLAPGLDQRSRVVPDHDVGSSDKRDESRLCRDPGLDTQPSAATIDLEDLVTLAWDGYVRVPHFQRDFRWNREDVIRLFDSILKGYPVGSLLLWVRPAPEQTIRLGALKIPAPNTDRAFWVVDGQQRITSLANALDEDGASDPRFALAYDLRIEKFVPRPATDDSKVIPLPVVFDL